MYVICGPKTTITPNRQSVILLIGALLSFTFSIGAQARSEVLNNSTSTSKLIQPQAPAPTNRASLAWKIGLEGKSFANENSEQAQMIGVNIRGKLNYRILDDVVQFHSDAGVAIDAGRAQSRFGDTLPQNGFF